MICYNVGWNNNYCFSIAILKQTKLNPTKRQIQEQLF